MELAGMRKDVAFAREHHPISERRACKLLGMDRGSYRYEPRPDHNAKLREALVALARQKPRYGYRRLHALLERRDYPASVMRIYRLYRKEGLAVRRLGGSGLHASPSARTWCGATRSGRWISRPTRWRPVEAFVF
jgi:putative transposase